MAGKYDWKPGQGVRSVGEVFNLIVMENGILAGTLTGATGGERPAPITDPERLQEALKPPTPTCSRRSRDSRTQI